VSFSSILDAQATPLPLDSQPLFHALIPFLPRRTLPFRGRRFTVPWRRSYPFRFLRLIVYPPSGPTELCACWLTPASILFTRLVICQLVHAGEEQAYVSVVSRSFVGSRATSSI